MNTLVDSWNIIFKNSGFKIFSGFKWSLYLVMFSGWRSGRGTWTLSTSMTEASTFSAMWATEFSGKIMSSLKLWRQVNCRWYVRFLVRFPDGLFYLVRCSVQLVFFMALTMITSITMTNLTWKRNCLNELWDSYTILKLCPVHTGFELVNMGEER